VKTKKELYAFIDACIKRGIRRNKNRYISDEARFIVSTADRYANPPRKNSIVIYLIAAHQGGSGASTFYESPIINLRNTITIEDVRKYVGTPAYLHPFMEDTQDGID